MLHTVSKDLKAALIATGSIPSFTTFVNFVLFGGV